jgi:hypothetical protein
MRDCHHSCPLHTEGANTYDLHPACIPCDNYRKASRSEDLLQVGRDTTVFTLVAAGALSLILAAQVTLL